jgi:hypothetical protein
MGGQAQIAHMSVVMINMVLIQLTSAGETLISAPSGLKVGFRP